VKAVSYEGTRKMSVSDHSKPKLKSPTDALLRVTTSGICGSDLHMYDGRTPLDNISIEEAPNAYEKFDQRIDGYTKVLIKFGAEKKAA
jgi:threonine dehydrogenase-like Zn-dependent dehydrogenase